MSTAVAVKAYLNGGYHPTGNYRAKTAAPPAGGSLNFNSDGPDSLLILSRTCPKGSDDIQGPRLSARSRSRNRARMSFAGRPVRPALRRPRTPDYFRLYPTTICAPRVVDFLDPRAVGSRRRVVSHPDPVLDEIAHPTRGSQPAC
jgi:hypothetical protein